MSNIEELNYAIISELRDQLEAKEQMIKKYQKQLEIAIKALETAYTYPSSTSLKEWCEELGIKSSTFFQRLKNGLNPFTGERV